MSDPSTVAIHADDGMSDLPDVGAAIRPSTTFVQGGGGRTYRRYSHETTERLEAVIGALEGGIAVAYPSGMAAIAAVLRTLRPQRVALPREVYHGTRDFVEAEAGLGAWELAVADETRPGDLSPGDVWWIETPSNPRCLITDIAADSEAARHAGVRTVVDSTFATPVLQHPLGLGADAVVHATTKFIGGHSDAMGGVTVVSDTALATALRAGRGRDGAIPGALDAWLVLRGTRTLPLRVQRQSASAMAIALALESRSLRVWYPGLESHPAHEVARRQMSAFGGILSFEMDGPDRASAVVASLRLFTVATSLGGVESLAEHRITSDPSAPPGLIRLSIGLEGAADLIDDLGHAIDHG